MVHIINNPHGLYFNGELIGVITNPDPIGGIESICEYLSPDEGLADTRPFKGDIQRLIEVLRPLPEYINVVEDEDDDDDDDDDVTLGYDEDDE